MRAPLSPLPDSRQALACLLLWRSGSFDTFEIAGLMHIGEDVVARTIQAARDETRILAREGGR